jgi:IS30 family transposase
MPRQPGRHLTQEERCQISSYFDNGYSRKEISALIGRHSTVIGREIKRNSGVTGYEAEQAHKNYALRRSVASSRPKKITPERITQIKTMLVSNDASPEQISGRLKLEYKVQISHEAIYQFIWKDKQRNGDLWDRLRHRTKPYNKRSGKKAGRGLIPNRIDIDQRPKIVDSKLRFGDLELDTIVGAKHKGAIVSIVDRASKLTWLIAVRRATADRVSHAIRRRLWVLARQGLIHTYTSDNGSEFARHAEITRWLGGRFFFAKPYHSWERGLNEHTNGLVRQYLPKGTEFTNLTQSELSIIENKLNNRPRKILGFQTPLEVAQALVARRKGDLFAVW